MRPITVAVGGIERLGAIIDGCVIDRRGVADALALSRAGHDIPALPTDMMTLLRLGTPGLAAAGALLDTMGASDTTNERDLSRYTATIVRVTGDAGGLGVPQHRVGLGTARRDRWPARARGDRPTTRATRVARAWPDEWANNDTG